MTKIRNIVLDNSICASSAMDQMKIVLSMLKRSSRNLRPDVPNVNSQVGSTLRQFFLDSKTEVEYRFLRPLVGEAYYRLPHGLELTAWKRREAARPVEPWGFRISKRAQTVGLRTARSTSEMRMAVPEFLGRMGRACTYGWMTIGSNDDHNGPWKYRKDGLSLENRDAHSSKHQAPFTS